MAPRPRIPPELKLGPFSIQEAEAAGISRFQLAGRSWIRLSRGQYAWSGLRGHPDIAILAALRRLPPTAVISGWTAAYLHGLDDSGRIPIEVTLPNGNGVSTRVGIAVMRRRLEADEVVSVRGLAATSVCRTLRDLSWRLDLTETVVLIDGALRRKLIDLPYLGSWLALRPPGSGTHRLRSAALHAEPLSESPMETRLRMLLALRGLPRPAAQVTLCSARRDFLGRPDLYYPEARLGLEYDGGTHRESLSEDNRRQNRLLAAGIRLLRYTAGDIYNSPDRVAAEVRDLLKAAA